MATNSELRTQPPPEALAAVRAWLDPVRRSLGDDFLSAYLTGSVLVQGFDVKKSHINVLVVARSLEEEAVDRLREAVPISKSAPHVDPLFLSRRQIESSLDSFPIEWMDIQERRLLLEGEDVFAAIEVPQTYLRLQLEHELRAKHIRLRQAYIASAARPATLQDVLENSSSSFATLFRTLLRLHGETPPASTAQTIERTADVFKLDAEGLLAAHLVRHGNRRYKADEIVPIYRKFLSQISRLVVAIDQLRVP